MTRPGGLNDLDLVRSVEQRLAGHPSFGDTRRIVSRAQRRHEFAVEILAGVLSGGAALVPTLLDGNANRTTRDPVVRLVLEDFLRRLERDAAADWSDLESVLAQVGDRLIRSNDLLPTQVDDELTLRAGTRGQIWIASWTAEPGPLLRRLRQAIVDQFIGHNRLSGQLCRADTGTARSVDRAGRLLAALLPRLGDEVVEHIAAITLLRATGTEGRQVSAAGGDLVPGTVVLDPDLLDSPWDSAGVLLHEALHLKMFDISRVFSLVSSPQAAVAIPWRRDIRWDTRRVLFAFHVYAHMILLQAAAAVGTDDLVNEFGEPPPNIAVSRGAGDEYHTATQRFRYLGDQLTNEAADHLTSDGRRLVGWLIDTTAPLTGWRPAQRTTREPAGRIASDDRTPVGTFVQSPGLVIRPEPELELALVFAPAQRALHCLNLNAWAVFHLCDGSRKIEADYLGLVSERLGPSEASRHLRLALSQLENKGLIRPVDRGGDLS
jgi:hypothetical protein